MRLNIVSAVFSSSQSAVRRFRDFLARRSEVHVMSFRLCKH
jgi:hypothetical protein